MNNVSVTHALTSQGIPDHRLKQSKGICSTTTRATHTDQFRGYVDGHTDQRREYVDGPR